MYIDNFSHLSLDFSHFFNLMLQYSCQLSIDSLLNFLTKNYHRYSIVFHWFDNVRCRIYLYFVMVKECYYMRCSGNHIRGCMSGLIQIPYKIPHDHTLTY